MLYAHKETVSLCAGLHIIHDPDCYKRLCECRRNFTERNVKLSTKRHEDEIQDEISLRFEQTPD